MWLTKVFSVIYFVAVCAALDPQDVTSRIGDVTTPTPVPKVSPTVYEPPSPSLKLQSAWPDVFVSEKVEFRCDVPGSSDWTLTWYINGNKVPEPDSNVSLSAEGSVLTITAATKAHAGSYSCEGQHKTKGVSTGASNVLQLNVNDAPKPSLELQTSWPDVFEEEMVEFICKVDSADWTIIWFKNQKELKEYSFLTIDEEESLLNITSVSQAHQGEYACKAHHKTRGVRSGYSNSINITVYENIPNATLSKDPGFNLMYVGETVNFTCKVDVASGWEYRWYKDGEVRTDTSETISLHLDLSHVGRYSCEATRSKMTSAGVSEEIQQAVLEIPVPSLNNITEWLDVFPAERVELRCAMEPSSDWTYTWYKDGHVVQADDDVSFDSNRANLSIKSSSAKHEGQYNCKGHLEGRSVLSNYGSGLTLTVYEKKPSVILTQAPDYRVMFPGESVSFSCHINVSSGWTYSWYKDNISLGVSEDKYTISSVGTTNRGTYTCQAKRGMNQSFRTDFSQDLHLEVKENKPKPSMTQQPSVDKMYTGESLSFNCKVELSSGWEYFWYKDEVPLNISSSSFNINHANLLHNGTYKCMARRTNTMYTTEHSDGQTLTITEIPVPSLKTITQWLDVFPTERFNLNCRMDGSSDWTYTWYKDGQKFQDDKDSSFGTDRTTLSIISASALHSGLYSCSAKLKSRSVSSRNSSGLRLDVYDKKPTVELMQNPKHDVMHTGDSVSFSCHINVSSGWEYLWYKDLGLLPESGNNHTITSVTTTNSGSYECQTKRGNAAFQSDKSQAVTLKIEERPQADIILLTGWSEVFSTDSLVLRCGVQGSQDVWNYTWYKESQQINTLLSEKHTVTPQNDPEQSWYTCKGIRTGRPSYSKVSEPFKTKNLLLKRRVLLSISGCIFFGIIAVFLGCIVLRVMRKPADDEDKQEESNLFLTMAQLKDCSDAPCPLVEYITDAALNAPPKEGDENGTICSETTPLPITSQEEQAVTTETDDTTENNGGLVSFKQ